MSDDKFFDRLRQEASTLRYEPRDDATWTRLAARIRSRIDAPQLTVAQLLARWFRPITVAMAGLAIATSVGFAYVENSREPATLEQMSSNSDVEIAVGGDVYSVND